MISKSEENVPSVPGFTDYYPWGGELQFVNNDSNHYKFTGKERDSESGLDYFGARYYSNGLGRFITPDWAAKAAAVPYAEFADPQSLNLYSYVRNIPTVKVDADGHCPPCDVEDETGVVIPEEEAIGTTSGTVGTDTAAGTGTAAATDASAGVGEAVIQDTAGAIIGTIIETVGTVLLPTPAGDPNEARKVNPHPDQPIAPKAQPKPPTSPVPRMAEHERRRGSKKKTHNKHTGKRSGASPPPNYRPDREHEQPKNDKKKDREKKPYFRKDRDKKD